MWSCKTEVPESDSCSNKCTVSLAQSTSSYRLKTGNIQTVRKRDGRAANSWWPWGCACWVESHHMLCPAHWQQGWEFRRIYKRKYHQGPTPLRRFQKTSKKKNKCLTKPRFYWLAALPSLSSMTVYSQWLNDCTKSASSSTITPRAVEVFLCKQEQKHAEHRKIPLQSEVWSMCTNSASYSTEEAMYRSWYCWHTVQWSISLTEVSPNEASQTYKTLQKEHWFSPLSITGCHKMSGTAMLCLRYKTHKKIRHW